MHGYRSYGGYCMLSIQRMVLDGGGGGGGDKGKIS
jgi:hypothetical protein